MSYQLNNVLNMQSYHVVQQNGGNNRFKGSQQFNVKLVWAQATNFRHRSKDRLNVNLGDRDPCLQQLKKES